MLLWTSLSIRHLIRTVGLPPNRLSNLLIYWSRQVSDIFRSWEVTGSNVGSKNSAWWARRISIDGSAEVRIRGSRFWFRDEYMLREGRPMEETHRDAVSDSRIWAWAQFLSWSENLCTTSPWSHSRATSLRRPKSLSFLARSELMGRRQN